MLIGIDGNEANVKKRVGANVYSFNILRQLATKKNPNLKFRIYLKNSPLDDLPKQSLSWQYKIIGSWPLWTQWRLPLELFLEKDKPDVFFTPGHYAPRVSPIPTIISIMDLAFLRFPNDFKKTDLRQLTAWTKYSVKNAAHIFAISQATKKDIAKFYGIDAKKISVTCPGVEKFRTTGKKNKKVFQNLKNKYHIFGNYFISIGTLQPRKNIIRLIKAFEKQKLPDNFQLLIVGKKGWLYKEIFQTVRKLNLEKQIIFTGFVSDGELEILLKKAFALVLPSLYEGFGIPVVEAMASGVPVVVSNISSLPEVAGKAGIYINNPQSIASISQALAKVLKLTMEQRNDLIDKGFRQAKNFSWQKCGEKTLEAIQKLKKL